MPSPTDKSENDRAMAAAIAECRRHGGSDSDVAHLVAQFKAAEAEIVASSSGCDAGAGMNQRDSNQIAVEDGWAVAADDLQWILQRQHGNRWISVAFVRSTKAALARNMKEKGVPLETAEQLLAAVGDTFDHDQRRRQTARNACSSSYPVSNRLGYPSSSGLTLQSSIAA
jgi:hypothetical protein